MTVIVGILEPSCGAGEDAEEDASAVVDLAEFVCVMEAGIGISGSDGTLVLVALVAPA